MPNRVDESMTHWRGANFIVRIWGKEPALNPGPVKAFTDALDAADANADASLAELAACLDKFPAVSAYEIRDFEGQGVCCYPDWP